MAKGIIEQLQSKGEVTRGWLGIGIQDLTEALKAYYGIKGDEGVLVTKVFPGDPAEKSRHSRQRHHIGSQTARKLTAVGN